MSEVVVYTKPRCVYCFRVKRRLRRRSVAFEEIPAGKDLESARADLRERFGAGTFPQIVIGGRHIGGADALFALERSGELERLLAA